MGKKVIIIDDMPLNIRLLKEILEDEDYEVHTISTNIYRDALNRVAEIKPAAIFMDIMMPEITGYELCTKLKADKDLQRIPVIILTAMSDAQSAEKAFESGAQAFLCKPYDERDILHIIDTIKAKDYSKEEESFCIEGGNAYSYLCKKDIKKEFNPENTFIKLNRNRKHFQEAVDSLEKSISTVLKAIRNYLLLGDFNRAAQQAHALKGLLLFFGAYDGVEIISKMEECLKENDIASSEIMINSIEQEASNIIQQLRTYISIDDNAGS